MDPILLSGVYSTKDKNLSLGQNDFTSFDPTRIAGICASLIKEGVVNHTIELDSDDFIFFRVDDDEVRIIGGEKKYYIDLQKVAKFQKDAAIFFREQTERVNGHGVASEMSQIHNSLFPSIDTFKSGFKNAEIFFKPYEEPGGDFYWAKNYQHKSLLVVGDCTGHGMQGAMIAMSVLTLLKQFFRLPPISIGKSIEEFYSNLKSLNEAGEIDSLDVELGFLLRDLRSNKVDYIGSGVNLIHRRGKEVEIHASRKTRVLNGKQEVVGLELKKNDQLFMYSDGITDQFDAEDNKKLGSKKLLGLIENIKAPVTSENFVKALKGFAGDTKSLDDQTLLILTFG